MIPDKTIVHPGDLVQLVSPTNKILIFQVIPGKQLHTHRGIIDHDGLIGKAWGNQIYTHNGSSYYLIQPGLGDLLRQTQRNTQIMYPKDIGFVLVTMGIGPGIQVIEAGTGSGALTTALAWAVGEDGKVFSYENRPDMQNLARKNLDKVGLSNRVVFKLKDIKDGFDEAGVDALFLDLSNSYDYTLQAKNALRPGGYFGAILPTTGQVTWLIQSLTRDGFAFIEVCELMLRYYKSVPERFRPTDRMVAHTGYLIFARAMSNFELSEMPDDQDRDSSESSGESPDLSG